MRCMNAVCKGIMRPFKRLSRDLGEDPATRFEDSTFWIPVGPRRFKEVQPMMCDKCGDIKGRYTGWIRELSDE